MIDFSNKWKILSIGLMVVLATGFVAPQALAAPTNGVQAIVTDIQSQVENAIYGLQAIQNNVNTKASQTSVNSLQTTAAAISTSTSSIQTSVNSLQIRESYEVCKVGPSGKAGIAISLSPSFTVPGQFQRILVKDFNHTAPWEMFSAVRSNIDNFAPTATQSFSDDFVMLAGGPMGSVTSTGAGVDATALIAGDTIGFIVDYTSSGDISYQSQNADTTCSTASLGEIIE